MPAVDPRLHEVIAACSPAHLAHQNVTLAPGPMNHERSRLQGKAGKAIDIVTLSRFWKHAPSNVRETIQLVAGPGTGLLWSDCSRDERSGWLQTHHFQQAFLNRLSLPRVAPGSTCALAKQTGAHKGQLCGMPLDSFGRHSHGACRAAGARTRVHRAICHCVTNVRRKAGVSSEEEVVNPELHEETHDGTVKEARMDVVEPRTLDDRRAHRRRKECDSNCSSKHRRRLQVSRARTATQMQKPCTSSERGAQRRHPQHGTEQVSWEAAIAKPSNGSLTPPAVVSRAGTGPGLRSSRSTARRARRPLAGEAPLACPI